MQICDERLYEKSCQWPQGLVTTKFALTCSFCKGGSGKALKVLSEDAASVLVPNKVRQRSRSQLAVKFLALTSR